ncbi:hypothetical protein HYV74_03635 [Candidatus Uhrbacteria bacterium]|nr:hypothetical protein [Candidatus Uhrbacteria bacterium]
MSIDLLVAGGVVLAYFGGVGLLCTELLGKNLRWDERIALAPFCAVAVTVLVIRVLRQLWGVWLPALPRWQVLVVMGVSAVLSVLIVVMRARRRMRKSLRARAQ